MKSTYKLLGVFWDKTFCGNDNPTLLRNSSTEYANRISLSQLLSLQNVDDIEMLLAQKERNSSVIIDVDYALDTDNKTINAFYEKRIRQIVAYLKLYFDEVLLCQESGDN